MFGISGHSPLLLTGLMLFADLATLVPKVSTEASYFEGRWAFAEENCDALTNWTLIAGGIFVSEDLTGSWKWADDQLILNLTDMAIDEETGEAGGRFQMEGPVEIKGADAFNLTIEPDIYDMKRCPETSAN